MRALTFAFYSSITIGAYAQEPLPLAPSVLQIPVSSALGDLKGRLLAAKSSPQSVSVAGEDMLRMATGDFGDDILSARAKAGKAACFGDLSHYSGRVRALVFSEQFWRTLATGKTYQAIRRQIGPRGDVDLAFTEFHARYLNEFANAWEMRSKGNPLAGQCQAHGVDDVAACLKVILVAGISPTACKIDLADHMFVYLPQPVPDQQIEHP